MAAATIVHDTSEAVELCAAHGLFLKPITKMTISVALPALRQPGKSISNWEVMERLKAMVAAHQFSTLRIAKSTMDFIRFEGEVENRALVRTFLARLDGKTIKLSGFADALRVRAAEFKADFPSRHDWDSFFRDARDMNETLPGERPDTVHLEGLPCKWFAPAGSERPSEDVLVAVFERFGAIRHVDIPMLDPYREEMTGRAFHTFSFGGHLNFEAYVQYREYAGFLRAMAALRGMKLMFKGDDGKAVACNIKLARAKAARLAAREREEERRRSRLQAERRRVQEAELRRVEEEKRRALGLQRKERALRERLLGLLLAQGPASSTAAMSASNTMSASTVPASTTVPASSTPEDALLRPVLRLLRSVQALATPSDTDVASRPKPDPAGDADAMAGAPENQPPPPPPPRVSTTVETRTQDPEDDKCNRRPLAAAAGRSSSSSSTMAMTSQDQAHGDDIMR
ncbi:PREDICTED: A-kinase anchor protein 17A [Dipodomys ordii]|uniref:A-kinase anchor protein 17A n=1 Tax=Dipodomys ordii TaxID=10020 RepID=A0A1S3GRG3_DIPOR|nr:PREDICTED: A-kinase anchor protein 17A [Dipodomys ordii]